MMGQHLTQDLIQHLTSCVGPENDECKHISEKEFYFDNDVTIVTSLGNNCFLTRAQIFPSEGTKSLSRQEIC